VARYLTATMFFWMNLVNGVSDGGSRRASASSDGVIGASERQTSRVNRVTASMKKRPALEHRIWMAARYRVERFSFRAGVAPAEVQRLSRRAFATTILCLTVDARSRLVLARLARPSGAQMDLTTIS